MSRQAYYKRQKARDQQRFEEAVILDAVKQIRRTQPRVGGRKLHRMLMASGLRIGRDKLFRLLKENNLLIKPSRRSVRTTQSSHRFRKHPNRIKELEITRPNQVFVADITYIDTHEGFCYLALITDAYSRKIVGYDLSQSLAIEGCQRALEMALEGVSEPEKLIHHSDRGIQYCSHGYVGMLEAQDIQISMTEEHHVYENALAERVNGILKTEFLLGQKLLSVDVAVELVQAAIPIYNNERLHMALDYETPAVRYAA